jgi:LmbE family N-acetylglucosaminyl deacetylase
VQPFTPVPPVCFISTHLDDVALSCAHWLGAHPGASVLTVLAGAPSVERRHGWNYVTTGEAFAPEAIRVRRSEDVAALATLAASPYWIDLWDSQYVGEEREDGDVMQASIRDLLEAIRPRSVVGPIGVHHPDHIAVADACLDLAGASDLSWYGYLDLPYARTFADEVGRRLAGLRARKATVDLVACEPFLPTADIKERAVGLYRSQDQQVRADHPGFERALTDPERFWAIERTG